MENHELAATESVTRFTFSNSQIDFNKNKLKYTAFIPPKQYPNEISVFRNSTLTEDETWGIGSKLVEMREKPLLGRGDLLVSEIIQIKSESMGNLKVEKETSSHELHANIMNIPTNKPERKLVALKLSEISNLVVR